MTLNAAANDIRFRSTSSRNLPIRQSFRRLDGFPESLCLYKIPASRFWQMRVFHKGKLITRSTRAERLEVAEAFAKRFFLDLEGGVTLPSYQLGDGQSLIPKVFSLPTNHVNAMPTCLGDEQAQKAEPPHLFQAVATQLLRREVARCERGELAWLCHKADRIRLERRIIPFLGGFELAAINPRDLESFLLGLESEELSSTSLSLHLMSLRKVMRYALTLGLIDALPIFPKVRIRKRSRGAFTPTEYVQVLRKARASVGMRLHNALPEHIKHRQALADRRHDPAGFAERFWILPRYWELPPDLPWVIAFMVNSFIRPSDLKTLKHRHVEVVRGDFHYLRLTLPETKAHDKPIVTLRPAIRVYQRMLAHWGARGLAKPDDYLFLPKEKNRAYALSVLGWMFRQVLESLGLREGPHGNPRTLYSLRHTAITLRLLYGKGIDILTLARNARTSVEMIEKHYASTLTGERNIGMLQSKRTIARPKI